MPTLEELRAMFAEDAPLAQEDAPVSAPGGLHGAKVVLEPGAKGWPSWKGVGGAQHGVVRIHRSNQRRWGHCRYDVTSDYKDAQLRFGKYGDPPTLLSTIVARDPSYTRWLLRPENAMNPDIVAMVKALSSPSRHLWGTPDPQPFPPGHPWYEFGECPWEAAINKLICRDGNVWVWESMDPQRVLYSTAKARPGDGYAAVVPYQMHIAQAGIRGSSLAEKFHDIVENKRP